MKSNANRIKRTCGECIYYVEEKGGTHCHANPPTVIDDDQYSFGKTEWPYVNSGTCACGMFGSPDDFAGLPLMGSDRAASEPHAIGFSSAMAEGTE